MPITPLSGDGDSVFPPRRYSLLAARMCSGNDTGNLLRHSHSFTELTWKRWVFFVSAKVSSLFFGPIRFGSPTLASYILIGAVLYWIGQVLMLLDLQGGDMCHPLETRSQ